MEIQHPFAAITPTVDGDVLHVIARSDAAFTVPQLSGLIPWRSVSGIRNAAERLAQQGTLTTHTIGRTREYALNDEHLLASAIRSIAGSASLLVHRIQQQLESWHAAPVFAAIFGSAARGEMRRDSDLDLFVVRPANVDDEHWYTDVANLTRGVAAMTGNDVRIIDLAAEEVSSSAHVPLLQNIVNDGITLIGQRDWLVRQIRKAS